MNPRARPRLTRRSLDLEPFLAMEAMERAFEMQAAGVDVVHLEIGEPAGPPPAAALEACTRALADGETNYTDSRGLLELREAIAANCAERFGVSPDPARILVTSGTSPAMLLAFSLLIDAGDEVVLPAPVYPCYPNFIRYCGGVPVTVPTAATDGYALDPERVAAALTPRTRAILVNSPANPTGAVQSPETMRRLAEFGLPILSDEIYDGLLYGGARITSALTLDADAFVFDGFSKRYAMTGFRLGWLVAPEWAMRPLQTLQQNLFISASRFVQHAGIAALRHGHAHIEQTTRACAARRDRLVAGLRALGFVVPVEPAGAFYVLADARRFGSDSRRLSSQLLERARVGTTPGIDFGPTAEGWLRFCYAVDDSAIEEALARLAPVLAEIAHETRTGEPA